MRPSIMKRSHRAEVLTYKLDPIAFFVVKHYTKLHISHRKVKRNHSLRLKLNLVKLIFCT
jgi:hypothetical protein